MTKKKRGERQTSIGSVLHWFGFIFIPSAVASLILTACAIVTLVSVGFLYDTPLPVYSYSTAFVEHFVHGAYEEAYANLTPSAQTAVTTDCPGGTLSGCRKEFILTSYVISDAIFPYYGEVTLFRLAVHPPESPTIFLCVRMFTEAVDDSVALYVSGFEVYDLHNCSEYTSREPIYKFPS